MAVEREFGGFVVDLATFAGPLDLLLHLIRREEVDILDIPIAAITDQFLAALAGLREHQIDVTGEFLVVAATLLQIKSRMVLPRPPTVGDDEAEDPRRELVELLLEYQQYKEAAGLLDDLALVRRQQFAVPAEGLPSGPPPLAAVSLTALLQAYSVLLSKRVPPPAPRLREERFNLQQQAARILDRLASGPLE
ncbi:MAG: segregation/condensation protein A, partial [Fimbriimonadaceae bacterium]|nr:segregation/condensation protein A [Fimbriimonadaceae bacterium]